MHCFDELPALVERLVGEHDRVALLYVDALAWRFVERRSEHPLLRRAEVERWTSCFPSTTTVHSTTIHSGLPLREHGLYEWNVYEPKLDRLITPLWFSFAGDRERDTLLAAGLEPADVFPSASLYERLPVPSHVAMPAAYAASLANRRLLSGASVHPFESFAVGLSALAGALAGEERAYGHIHVPDLDTLMHLEGPDAPAVGPLVESVLSAAASAPWPEGTRILLTADHGMTAISPARTSYVNVVWPELARHLVHGADGKPLAPAGSARDLFLHVLPDRLDDVLAELGSRLEGKADVRRTDELFADAGPALRARLANLVVLPHEGEAAYWLEPGRFEQRFHGQHGGLSAEETEIPLISWTA